MNLGKNLKKGEVVFHEGNPSDDAYIIGLGSVEILENTASGQKVMEIPGENEIFGELGLIDGLPRLATARAREDSVVYVLPLKPLTTLSRKIRKPCCPSCRF